MKVLVIAVMVALTTSMSAQRQEHEQISESDWKTMAEKNVVKYAPDAVFTGLIFVRYDSPDFPVTMGFDDAKATVWRYRFYSKSRAGRQDVRVSATHDNVMFAMAEKDEDIPKSEIADCSLPIDSFISARQALETAKASGLDEWRKKHPDAVISLAVLFDNSCNSAAEIKGRMWRFDVRDQRIVYRCYVDAIRNSIVKSGEVPRTAPPSPQPMKKI